MATRSVASSQLKKKSGPLQRRFTNSDTVSSSQSTGVVTSSMTRAAATSTKRTVACASLHSTDGINMNDGVSKSLPVDPLKGKSTSTLKMKQQSPFFGAEDYYSSDSSASPSKKVVLLQSEVESSQTVIMPAMMIRAVNFEEEFASMKAMLERLSEESVEKDTRIKRQEEHIAKLLKKLDKGARASSNRGASSDESEKGSNRSEASEDDDGLKKGGKPHNDSSLSAMTTKQIQELIVNTVKT